MTFADFLDVMHVHTKVENLPKEVIDAFRAGDNSRCGTIPARRLAHLMLNWGERLSNKEGLLIIFLLLNISYYI